MTFHIGRHRFSIEEPDIAVVVLDGDVSAEEIKELYDLAEEQARERVIKQFFVLQDVARMGAIGGPRWILVSWRPYPIEVLLTNAFTLSWDASVGFAAPLDETAVRPTFGTSLALVLTP